MSNPSKGIAIKNYVNIQNSAQVLVIRENIIYNKVDLPKYKEMFQQLYEDGELINGDFDDNVWLANTSEGINKMNFNFDVRPEINVVLKCYVLVKVVGRNTDISTGVKSLNGVRISLLKTNFFNIDYLVEYRESLPTWSDYNKQNLYFVRELLKFYDFGYSSEYLNILSKVHIPTSKHRLLPDYRSILQFDSILKDFIMNKADIRDKEKFYPLLLWWMLTKVLPLRPIEFSILKRNCCIYSEKEKCHYITVERRKKRGILKFKKVPTLNKIKITKEIYDLFNDYANLIDPTKKNIQLFTYESYTKCLDVVNIDSDILADRDSSSLAPKVLRYLLYKFYTTIVEKKYSREVIEKDLICEIINDNQIHRIQLGDTRHIAICSMLLQGLNPLTIAMLAGHNTLREQMSYYGHLETFVDAHTYLLAKNLKNTFLTNIDNMEIYNDYRKNLLAKERLGNNFYKLRKVKGGRCESDDFPNQCILDECIFCIKHFIRDETLTEEMLNNILSKVDKEILSKLDYIRTMCKGLTSNNKGESSSHDDEALKTQSNSLSAFTNKKVLLLSYKMKLSEELKSV